MAGKKTAFNVKWLDKKITQHGWQSRGILSLWKVSTLYMWVK